MHASLLPVVFLLASLCACASASSSDAVSDGGTDLDSAGPEPDAFIVEPTPSVCGDNEREGSEVCDDGNLTDGDGCSADCLSDESCGNGILDDAADEVCDDGNLTNADGCSANCLSDETCGNEIIDSLAGEACEDGNFTDGDGCSADCLSDETCGNDILDTAAGEVCDDGGTLPGDGCSANCQSFESCGNDTIDSAAGEICDDGNNVDGDGCSANCRSDETCGNSVLDTPVGEVCEDGNVVSGDGCSDDCRSDESCGNAILDTAAGEVCEDSNTIAGDGCAADCRSTTPLLVQDFESANALGGWTVIDEDGRTPDDGVSFMTAAWIVATDGINPSPANKVGVSTSFYDPTGRADDWLVTPPIDLDAHSTLSWRAYAVDSSFRDGYEVRISRTTGTVGAFLSNAALFSVSQESSSWNGRSVDLAAAGYAGETVRIAFRNDSNNKFLLFVDSIVVE